VFDRGAGSDGRHRARNAHGGRTSPEMVTENAVDTSEACTAAAGIKDSTL